MDPTISCIVLEDEERSLNLMCNLIGQIPKMDLLAAFRDPEKAFTYLQTTTPDLIFLDIKNSQNGWTAVCGERPET